jgi:hypothetical protein
MRAVCAQPLYVEARALDTPESDARALYQQLKALSGSFKRIPEKT